MPCRSLGKGCWKWGKSGKRYCGAGAHAKCIKQGKAAHAREYKGGGKK